MKQLFQTIAMSILTMLAVVFAVTPAYATSTKVCDPSSSQNCIGAGAKGAQGTGQSEELFGNKGIFTTITNTLLFLIGAVSVIMIIYAGIQYATSGGDSGKVTSAKNTILYAVVGIVVAVLAYAIVNFVVNSLSTTTTSSGLIRLF